MGHDHQDDNPVDLKLPFPWKLHKLLEGSDANKTSDIVSWLPDGLSFKVYNTQEFTDQVMPSFFSQTKYNSFRRQCYIYGFRLCRDGAFFHPMFRRDNPETILMVKRNQEGDRRKKKKIDRISSQHSQFHRPPQTMRKGESLDLVHQRSNAEQTSSPSGPYAIPSIPPSTETQEENSNIIPQDEYLSPAIQPGLLQDIQDVACNILRNSHHLEPLTEMLNCEFTFEDNELETLTYSIL